jgi:hypothetical protein
MNIFRIKEPVDKRSQVVAMSHHHQPTLTAFFQARRRPVDTQAAKRRKICAEDTLAQPDDAQVSSTYEYEHSLLICCESAAKKMFKPLR